ncbi:Short-chain fatty acids transporter [Enhygromyxa salina]|uniref:Short-chain fatty acids transporter n=1 Tax=Enhygromyxa salina TaxID=215803 RepID=A0A2S9XDQ8_9BACT|nr:TIGR00366 family protein [Enhygromyxa salina]PRP90992.1 Short-chain fatty acids transporter [Enhygromyxa salina]
MGPLARLGLASRRGFGRVTPDPFVVAVALSVLVLIVAVVAGDWPGGAGAGGPFARIGAAIDAWGNSGLWKLLGFAMQMVMMLVLGTALAEAPVVRQGIARLARVAPSPRVLVAITAVVSIGLGLLSWSLSLIGGAILAREGGRQAKLRGWQLHYPILCAAAYSGLMCWHGGLSGTAPLKATTKADMVEVLGEELAAQVGTISLEHTLLSPLNLFVSGGLLVLGPLLFALLTPREGQDPAPEPQPDAMAADDLDAESVDREPPPTDPLERIERSTFVVWALAFPLLAALILKLARQGFASLDINTVNLALWVLALLLHGRPQRFLAACAKGIQSCTGIVLQFPLYAGIMAVMAASGLSARLTALVSSAGPGLLAPLTFMTAGLLNLLVPSGGGQWVVQGPIIMEAALATGTDAGQVLMAMAYGDQWTNMLQPFWALPLLAVTGVRARDIVGYTVLWMAAGGVWMLLGLTLLI